MNRRHVTTASLGAAGVLLATNVLGHHAYTMFDNTRRLTVSGTVAEHHWTNPHSYIWVYVPNAQEPGKEQLYGFENGSPQVLVKSGWSKNSLRKSDRIIVEYVPARDGGLGGHCARVTLANGRILNCDGIGRMPPVKSVPQVPK